MTSSLTPPRIRARTRHVAEAAAAADPLRPVRPLRICILGLSITSSWGNGHATIFRALARSMAARGHQVTFLERDVPWYAQNRDCPDPPGARVHLYGSVDALRDGHRALIAEADVVMVGSYVPDGIAVSELVKQTAGGVRCFYDIDTPVTLAALRRGDCAYLRADQVADFDIYFSFTGGQTLRVLEEAFGSPAAVPLYCAVDTERYQPDPAVERDLDLGYMGTYSDDRQPTVESLLLEPARRLPSRRFALVGPMYPPHVSWAGNVERVEHLPPAEHPRFYNRQRFTLNVTRAEMRATGYAPSVRLFEAAACGTAVISDRWPGLDELFPPGEAILLADTTDEVLGYLRSVDEAERQALGDAARQRVLRHHTAEHRVSEVEAAVLAVAL